MNESKLLVEFYYQRYTFTHLAEKYNLPKADVVAVIRKFIRYTTKKKLGTNFDKLLKATLVRDFMSLHYTLDSFCEEYGLPERSFVSLLNEVIEDREMVKSDNLADSIFRKYTSRRTFISTSVPPRIVRIIALHYVSSNISQKNLGVAYNCSRNMIGALLKRGIAEDILEDELADMVFGKAKNNYKCSPLTLQAYYNAFDKKEETRRNKEIKYLEALLESDEPVNYSTVQRRLDELKN